MQFAIPLAISAATGLASHFFGQGRGFKDAQGQLQNYYNQGLGYQQPYNQAGQQQGQNLNGAINHLMNPQDLQSQWINSYETSPYAKQLMQQSKESGLDAASSMGLIGSTPALQGIQAGQTNIMNADRQQYLKDLMEKYTLGTNLSQNIYNTGASTASQMANQANQMGQNMGSAAYGATVAPWQDFGNMLGFFNGRGAFNNLIGTPVGGKT